jgi:hypothetical protein
MSPVSRVLDLAPLAVTSDGTLFVNVAKLTTATDLESVVRGAQEDARPVFVGVMMSVREAELVMASLDNAADETAANIAGQRRRRAATRSRRTTRS